MNPAEILAKIHREYREECIRMGTYKGIDPRSVYREMARHRAECNRPPRTGVKRPKKPPRGTAD